MEKTFKSTIQSNLDLTKEYKILQKTIGKMPKTKNNKITINKIDKFFNNIVKFFEHLKKKTNHIQNTYLQTLTLGFLSVTMVLFIALLVLGIPLFLIILLLQFNKFLGFAVIFLFVIYFIGLIVQPTGKNKKEVKNGK